MIVKQLAKKAKVTPHTVRHYVKLGLLSPSRDDYNGYHYFNESDISRVCFIQQAKSLGFSLKEIKLLLEDAQNSQSPCPRAREILQKRITENHRRLSELIHLQKRMEDALMQWQGMPNGLPNGDHICHLIAATAPKE